MPLARSLSFLSLGLICATLSAQDPAPKTTEKAPEVKVETTKNEDSCDRCESRFSYRKSHRHFHFGRRSTFGAYVQGILPLRDLKDNLDRRTGYGLGMQWTSDHGDWHGSRTRMEWNTFPEGGAVAGTRTYAKNFTVSWDHLFKLNKGETQAYLVAGVGGARWYEEQNTGGLRYSHWTTKPAITAGIGVQIAQRVNLEARYVASSINKTFDANTLQTSLGWRF